MQTPLISVIINNYNYVRYIKEAIESVISQTYSNWELIIVDDGSTDGSRLVISEYTTTYSNKIQAVFKENGGQASTFNMGFRHCRGDIICFLDSDDIYMKNKLERVSEQCPINGFLLHGWVYKGATGQVPYEKITSGKSSAFEKLLASGNCWPTSQIAFSAHLLKKILPMPEEKFRISADAYLMFRCAELCEPYILRESLGIYRVHGNNRWFDRENQDKVKNLYKNILEQINMIRKESGKSLIERKELWSCIKKASEESDKFIVLTDSSYIIFGSGQGGLLIKEYIQYCGAKVSAFLDSDDKKSGSYVNGIPVISIKELLKSRNIFRAILIGSRDYMIPMSENLNNMGYRQGEDYFILNTVLFSLASYIYEQTLIVK